MPFDDLLRDHATLQQLEPEEVGSHLLERFANSSPEGGRTQHLGNLINGFRGWGGGGLTPEIEAVITEAWRWLDREGFIVESATSEGWYYISRRGRRALESGVPAQAIHQSRFLPKEFLHPAIADRVFPLFLRGDYENAVLIAFKEVEIETRTTTSLPNSSFGVALMREAFHPDTGRLTDLTQLPGEREALSHLFAGAIGSYRNATGHRRVNLEAAEAAEMIILASHLLRIVDARRPTGPAAAATLAP